MSRSRSQPKTVRSKVPIPDAGSFRHFMDYEQWKKLNPPVPDAADDDADAAMPLAPTRPPVCSQIWPTSSQLTYASQPPASQPLASQPSASQPPASQPCAAQSGASSSSYRKRKQSVACSSQGTDFGLDSVSVAGDRRDAEEQPAHAAARGSQPLSQPTAATSVSSNPFITMDAFIPPLEKLSASQRTKRSESEFMSEIGSYVGKATEKVQQQLIVHSASQSNSQTRGFQRLEFMLKEVVANQAEMKQHLRDKDQAAAAAAAGSRDEAATDVTANKIADILTAQLGDRIRGNEEHPQPELQQVVADGLQTLVRFLAQRFDQRDQQSQQQLDRKLTELLAKIEALTPAQPVVRHEIGVQMEEEEPQTRDVEIQTSQSLSDPSAGRDKVDSSVDPDSQQVDDSGLGDELLDEPLDPGSPTTSQAMAAVQDCVEMADEVASSSQDTVFETTANDENESDDDTEVDSEAGTDDGTEDISDDSSESSDLVLVTDDEEDDSDDVTVVSESEGSESGVGQVRNLLDFDDEEKAYFDRRFGGQPVPDLSWADSPPHAAAADCAATQLPDWL